MNEEKKRNIWLDGIMGVVTGDALGCPVEFKTREEINKDPVTGMRSYGTFNMPAGTWTDDSSMTLATLDSILERGKLNFPDVMYRFVLWLAKGEYTPFGEAFDVGGGTMDAITRYMRMKEPDINECGGVSPENNGNGSLMRIMPACLYLYQRYHLQEDDTTAIWAIHKMSGLTHNHLRTKIACGLYYFMVCQMLDAKRGSSAQSRITDAKTRIPAEGIGAVEVYVSLGGPTDKASDTNLMAVLQKGLDRGFAYYAKCTQEIRIDEASGAGYARELFYYDRIRELEHFATLPCEQIHSHGYVVDTIEAALWCLITTESYRECALKAVNLGYDTDTIAAIAGGLAGLWYGYDGIPREWLEVIQRREWIEDMCGRAERLFCSPTSDIMESESGNSERE